MEMIATHRADPPIYIYRDVLYTTYVEQRAEW